MKKSPLTPLSDQQGTQQDAPHVRWLGRVDCLENLQAMREWTRLRTPITPDEIWVCEHPPVFTLGLAGNPANLLVASDIPLVQTDRGGQITYHGPGQLVVYPLLNLNRLGLKVREYVELLEQTVIECLADCGLKQAQRKAGAPGVYIPWGDKLAKIAALGVKVSRGCTYHGLALNVNMDLAPFAHINPCGYVGLETVDLFSAGVKISFDEMRVLLLEKLIHQLQNVRATVAG